MRQRKKLRRCAGGAVVVAVLAGLVALPASPALAAPTAPAATATGAAVGSDLAVTHGLQYAPGGRVGLTGTAAAGASVRIEGLPGQSGAVGRPVTVRANERGKWIVFTDAGSATAQSYELVITSGGSSITVTTRASTDHTPVQRAVTVPAGQTFVRGERPTVTGTADAYTSVQVVGLPGWKPGLPGAGAVADERGEWTVTGDQPASGYFVVEARGSGLGQNESVQEWVEQASTSGEFEAFTVDDGLAYAPGTRLALTGRTLPGAVVKVDGLPVPYGTPDSRKAYRTTATADGTWEVVTEAGLATAEHYDLTFTVGGSTVERRAVSDDSYAPVERDVTVTAGQTFVQGEVVTVTGTADAHTSVRVEGIPGRGPGYGVQADRDGNWSASSAGPVNYAFEVRVTGQQHGALSPEVTGRILPALREGEFEAFTVDRGLSYIPGRMLGVTGKALPYSRISVDGVPQPNGGTGSQVVYADIDGRWALMSYGEARADRYALTFSVGGSSVGHTAVADPDLEVIERDLAFAPGQHFVTGERATLRGTADADSVVGVTGLPGGEKLQIVLADADGNWYAKSEAPVTERTAVLVQGLGHGAVSAIQGAIIPEEGTASVSVATTSFTKGKKQLIEGTAAPKAKVDIYSGSKYLMHVTADADGKWSYTTGAVINTDTFTRTLKSEGAEDVTFTLIAAEQEQTAPITVSTTTFAKGQKQLIEGTAAPKSRVDVYSGSKYLMHVIAGADGKWSYTTGAVITDDTFTRTLKSASTKDVTFTLHAR